MVQESHTTGLLSENTQSATFETWAPAVMRATGSGMGSRQLWGRKLEASCNRWQIAGISPRLTKFGKEKMEQIPETRLVTWGKVGGGDGVKKKSEKIGLSHWSICSTDWEEFAFVPPSACNMLAQRALWLAPVLLPDLCLNVILLVKPFLTYFKLEPISIHYTEYFKPHFLALFIDCHRIYHYLTDTTGTWTQFFFFLPESSADMYIPWCRDFLFVLFILISPVSVQKLAEEALHLMGCIGLHPSPSFCPRWASRCL